LFNKKQDVPTEQRDYSKFYFLFSGILLVTTIWAVYDEAFTRQPWKEYQREYINESLRLWDEELDRAYNRVNFARADQLEEELAEVRALRQGEDYLSWQAEWRDLEEELRWTRQRLQFARGRAEETYYQYRRAVLRGGDTERLQQRLDRFDAESDEIQERIDAIEERQEDLEAMMEQVDGRIRDIQSEINRIYDEVWTIEAQIDLLRRTPVSIRQVVLEEFERTSWNEPKRRTDRCMTCHAGYRDDMFENYPQPLGKHPRQDLLDIHDIENFGCTPCHDGQPMALTAGMAHGYDDRHWEFPLLTGQDVYASCQDCHANEAILVEAPPFNRGRQIVMESGCVGCHAIDGYLDVPKVGPELNQLASKVSTGWIYSWLKDPKEYNPHTRMPDFRLDDSEAEAITAYLVNISTEYRPQRNYPGGGNPLRGAQLVESVGCMGCHVIGDDDRIREGRGLHYDAAPELSRVGSKVTADWLYDWIRNPKRYRPETRMPDMRLTDAEARDIVSYLISLDEAAHDDDVPLNLYDQGIIAEGESLIRMYGCHGCHDIQGMEREGRVSVALNNFGRKAVEEMDFGETDIEHTWYAWIYNKLRDSRIYETERIPQEMPVFNYTDAEIRDVVTFLRGMRQDNIGGAFRRTSDRMKDIHAGQKFVIDRNCIACHEIEGTGKAIAAMIADAGMQPPVISGIGSKVQEPWLYDFLHEPSAVRQWLEVRMPTYGLSDDDVAVLMRYFLAIEEQDFKLRDYERFTPSPEMLRVGENLFNQLQCARCHPGADDIPGELAAADLAPDLRMTRGRLKPDWINDWLHDPQEIEPGTRMPTFFPDGQTPFPQILDGDVDRQIEAVRDYTWSLGRPIRASR
jgi:cytochrome c2/predicted  nucleic acid-binding Zn-ribbon protein